MEMETRAESIVLDQAENSSLLGLKFGALINLERECQPNRGHREAHISPPEADVRSSVNRIALGTIIGEQPWREMFAADKAKRAITARCWAITRGRAAVGPCTPPPATSPWR